MTTITTFTLSTKSEVSRSATPEEAAEILESAAARRARLHREITAERKRRRVGATLEITGGGLAASEPLDEDLLTLALHYAAEYEAGRGKPYDFAIDMPDGSVATVTLTATQAAVVARAARDYSQSLLAASARCHEMLAATADADLEAFDVAALTAWPSLEIPCDLTAADAAAPVEVAAQIAALEARVAALEA